MKSSRGGVTSVKSAAAGVRQQQFEGLQALEKKGEEVSAWLETMFEVRFGINSLLLDCFIHSYQGSDVHLFFFVFSVVQKANHGNGAGGRRIRWPSCGCLEMD